MRIAADAAYLIADFGGFDLNLLDSTNLLVKGTMRGHRGLMVSIAFSPDGKFMASANADQTVRLWEMATQVEVGIVGGFGERVCDIQFSTDGQSIVLISGSGKVKVYKLSSLLQRGLFAKIPEQVSRLALSPDERYLAAISGGGTLTLWNRQNGGLIQSNSLPRDTQNTIYANLAFSPDGKRLAWVTGDALRIMLVGSGEISETPIDGNHEINSIAFSPNGGELAFGCGQQLQIYDLASGRRQPFAAPDDEVLAVEYSPDGALIAFGERHTGAVTLCERASGRVLSKVKAHPPHVVDVEMSPGGRLLATCGWDPTIKLWDVQPEGLRLHATLRGHVGSVASLAFSPDGTRLVSASSDQTLKICDTHRAAELATLHGHHHYVVSVEFAKDGRTIYSGGFDGEIHFWKAPALAEIDPAKAQRSKPTGGSNELK